MHPPHVAIYARVSSEQQAEAHTVASQVAALQERVAADGLTVSEAMPLLEEGYSGATLVRPALERLRDVLAAGSVDRYVTKDEGGGQARDEILPDEARVVRQVFAWGGHDRLTIGEVCRRLPQAGEAPRTGKAVWDRSGVGGILQNPASTGAAAFGKTRQEPRRPRRRAQRSRPVPPRRAVSTREVPPEDWSTIPVPALVEPEVCAAVREPRREHRQPARPSRRGALSLRHGLLPCQHGGYAFYGKRRRPSARQGKPRADASSRCLGTDASRLGGARLCQNTQVRTDLLELAGWQDGCTWLAHPERLAEAYRRRWQPETHTKRPPLRTVAGQIGKRRQGVARLLDRYAESLLAKGECEPRVTRRRQRLAPLEAQRQALAEEAAVHGALPLMIGRLEDCAAKLHDGLEVADWASKRDRIRALGKRVAVARDDVNIVFRIDPYPGDADPEKKSLQLCRGSGNATVS